MTDQTTPAPPARRQSSGQIAAIVTGSLAGMLALAAIVAGGLLLWGDSQKDRDGYLSTGSDRFHTSSYALATDDLDVEHDIPGVVSDDLLGKVRVSVTPRGDKPVFVGIARSQDVYRYLHRSPHATVTDVDYDPFRVTYRDEAGTRRPAPPAERHIWAASAQGSGTQSLTWHVKRGSWSVVVMNADGSAGVDTGVSVGAKLGWVKPAGLGALGGGVLLAVLSGGLLYAGLRRPRPRTDERDPSGLPALA
jgi:hypothetical protein